MSDQVIESLVDGGQASAAPPLGPALGPAGVSIPDVVAAINEKTKSFEGMQVPVKVIVHEDKSFDIEVGTPPVSAMLKKETGLDALSGKPNTQKLADIAIEQAIKIAEGKLDSLNTRRPKSAVKQIVGTCVSSGILVEGKDPKEVLEEIDEGVYDEKILNWDTEISEEKRKKLEEERRKLVEKAEKEREENMRRAEQILEENQDKERFEIINAMEEEDIPADIIAELVPAPAGAGEDEFEAEVTTE